MSSPVAVHDQAAAFIKWAETDLAKNIADPDVSESMATILKSKINKLVPLATTMLATKGSDEAIDSAALALWKAANPEEASAVAGLEVKIEKTRALLADLLAQFSDATESGVANYREGAKASAAQNGKAAKDAYNEAVKGIKSLIGSVAPSIKLPEFPGKTKGSSSNAGGSKGDGWTPELDTATTVNGNPVAPSGDRKFPTLADVKEAATGNRSGAREWGKTLAALNNDNRELPPAGQTFTITVNDNPVTIVLVPRKDADKAERGRKAEEKTAA